MKRSTYLIAVSLVGCAATFAQAESSQAAPEWQVENRAAHETTYETTRVLTNSQGRVITQKSSYVEVGTGLNYFDDTTQEWLPTREEWQAFPEGIMAQFGRHKIILSHNIGLADSVDILTPDNVRLRGNPVGIGLFDPVDGKHVMLAEVQDSQARLGEKANEIIYPEAFDNGFNASLQYVYTRAGFHQNLLIEQQIELPEGFSDRTRVEFYTEWNPELPVPAQMTRVIRAENNPAIRQAMLEPDFTDTTLNFGDMIIGPGKAFSFGNNHSADGIKVGKQFQLLEGRPVLIESVEWESLSPLLEGLAAAKPVQNKALVINKSRRIERTVAGNFRTKLPFQSQQLELASHSGYEKSVVLDYELLSGNTNDFTFKGDTTYVVTGLMNLTGKTIFEGGAVVKFTNNSTAGISIGTNEFQTSAFSPVVFTSIHDDSVGEIIAGSTGNPWTNHCGVYGLQLKWMPADHNVRHARFSHLTSAIDTGEGHLGDIYIDHTQIVRCRYPFATGGSSINVRNGLIYDADTVLYSGGFANFENVTVHRCATLANDGGYGASAMHMVNTLLVGVTNLGDFILTSNSTERVTSGVEVFKTVGAGSHYLAEASPYRNAGTTNINADLLSDLGKKTTYPPIVLTSLASGSVLQPQAQRDTDVPDIGYHYEPLDYAISNIVTDSVTITNGTAIAFFGDDGEGLTAETFISEGSPLNLNRLVWYNTVQEQSTVWNSVTPGNILSFNNEAEVKCRFTDFSRLSSPPGYGYHFVDGTNGGMGGTFSFQDCRFSSGLFRFQSMTNAQSITANLSLTNCLFERVNTTIQAIDNPISVYGFNNHFQWGSLTISTQSFAGNAGFTFRDNLMYRLDVTQSAVVTNSHNAVWFDPGNRFTPTNVADVVFHSLNEPEFTNGPLGNYYQVSSQCINNGSRNADLAALYHFTTTTNQVKETNTVVDIGLHYVSITNGLHADQDAEGIADYFEDLNGNGTHDAGETNWQNPDSDSDGVDDFVEWLQGRTGMVNGTATGAALNLNIYTPIE